MAGLTKEQCEARLNDWLAADEAVARNQSYQIGDRTLTRADAKEIRENISFWNSKIKQIDRGGARKVRRLHMR